MKTSAAGRQLPVARVARMVIHKLYRHETGSQPETPARSVSRPPPRIPAHALSLSPLPSPPLNDHTVYTPSIYHPISHFLFLFTSLRISAKPLFFFFPAPSDTTHRSPPANIQSQGPFEVRIREQAVKYEIIRSRFVRSPCFSEHGFCGKD